MAGLSSLSGVFDRDPGQVRACLTQLAAVPGQTLLPPEATGCRLLAGRASTLLIHPEFFNPADALSQRLSGELQAPVLSLHLVEEDLWHFVLFDQGQPVAWFNPVPDFGGVRVTAEERRRLAGDAAAVAAHLPGVAAADVARYFVPWNNDLSEVAVLNKAYPDDDYAIGDGLQGLDFLRRVGLPRPLAGNRALLGDPLWPDGGPLAGLTRRAQRLAEPARPWWRRWGR